MYKCYLNLFFIVIVLLYFNAGRYLMVSKACLNNEMASVCICTLLLFNLLYIMIKTAFVPVIIMEWIKRSSLNQALSSASWDLNIQAVFVLKEVMEVKKN